MKVIFDEEDVTPIKMGSGLPIKECEKKEFLEFTNPTDGRPISFLLAQGPFLETSRALLNQLQQAFNKIIQYFKAAKTDSERRQLGDDTISKPIVGLIRGDLCTALAQIFYFGFKADRRFYGYYHIWDFIFGYYSMKDSLFTELSELSMGKVILSLEKCTRDSDIKFRAFICASLNNSMIGQWGGYLVQNNPQLLERFYEPASIFRLDDLRTEFLTNLALLDNVFVSPFELTIDYEIRREKLLRQTSGTESSFLKIFNKLK